MTEAEGTLYLSSLPHNSVVDIHGEELFATFDKPHGLEFDGTNFWVADPNENKIYQYSKSGAFIDDYSGGADPVNMLHATVNGERRLFVADRGENEILGYAFDGENIKQDEADANNTTGSIIEIELDSYLNSKAIGSIDMAYDDANSILYVVSDEYDGLITVDLSTESSPVVGGTTYGKQSGDFGGLGVALDGNGLIYINTGNRILTFDGNDWGDLGVDLVEDSGHDYNGYYIDLVISSTDFTARGLAPVDYLYVASGISPEEEVDDDVPHHVIVYSHDGNNWTHHKTVDFDF
jgi:hypothetical protein